MLLLAQPERGEPMGQGIDIANGLIWFVAFLFSTTLHEAAHAWTALRGGDPTAYLGGQVTLSPLPHIRREPIGMVVVPLLTALTTGWAIGWASTPYDRYWASRHPKRAALMSAAGPAANLAIAALFFLVIRAGLDLGIAGGREGSPGGWVLRVALVFLVLNILLFVFNLLPLPPLDGASVLMPFLPVSAAEGLTRLASNPLFSLAGLLIAWKVFPYLATPLIVAILGLLQIGR